MRDTSRFIRLGSSRAPQLRWTFALLSFASLALTSTLVAQNQLQPIGGPKDLVTESDSGGSIGGRYVHDQSIGFLSVAPSNWWDNEMFRLYPTEILRVQAKESIGIDPQEIHRVQATFGLSMETGQPLFSAVLSLKGKIDGKTLKEALDLEPQPIDIGEHKAVRIRGQFPMVLSRLSADAQFDDGESGEIWYIGSPEWLVETAAASDEVDSSERGPLPVRLASLPKRDGISAVVEMKTIRPLVSGFAMHAAAQLPPRLQPLGQLPGLTDAILLHVDFQGEAVAIQLTLVGIDEPASEQIESILQDSLIEAQVLAMDMIQQKLAGSDASPAMQQAVQAYATRISAMLLQALQPLRVGRDVTIQTESELSVASTGVLAGLLLPAVQAGRTAARRVQSSNNIKQIMLAMHNHHAAYRQLPAAAITDENGKPLLSWRVKLLPFLEEAELYQQFRLDEPWDSEHNLQVAERVPATYQPVGVPLEPGHTIYQASVGEAKGLLPTEAIHFREFMDGLSNTILIVETNPTESVFWTKPDDISMEMESPLDGLGNAWPGGFHVGMADGAVKFITKNIDAELFRKMLTRAGREPLNLP
ncbi:DUF1559 domain-containing protein [Rhodopirellula halodulae]|uniref:DUF1559 domain-containing protein n=1 Tax=Rhodopirellula halodulae TaxID=2894198 RepID=UPI001E2A7473|nr:DUF1559 domain-containing protein [Rhodopirellula sp. JC737]